MERSKVYDAAELYDIAMSFKDVAAEGNALIRWSNEFGVGEPSSFLDIAAGPGMNAVEMARRGLRTIALDGSPGMIEYARERAEREGVSVEFVHADMRSFTIDGPVDMAGIFQGSLTVLLDNDAVLEHLSCMADAVVPGGIYVVENEHPRDLFGVGESVGSDWVTERDGLTVHMRWGSPDDVLDPTSQIEMTTVRVSWEGRDQRGEIVEVLPNRILLVNEFRALVAASGAFDIVAEFGSFDPAVPFDNAPDAWRYIPILKRRP